MQTAVKLTQQVSTSGIISAHDYISNQQNERKL